MIGRVVLMFALVLLISVLVFFFIAQRGWFFDGG
jgi:hypothetical protein